MAAHGYEFYLQVLKVSLTLSLHSIVRLSAREDKIHISKWSCNDLFIL